MPLARDFLAHFQSPASQPEALVPGPGVHASYDPHLGGSLCSGVSWCRACDL